MHYYPVTINIQVQLLLAFMTVQSACFKLISPLLSTSHCLASHHYFAKPSNRDGSLHVKSTNGQKVDVSEFA